MVTIDLGNVGSKEQAYKIASKIHGKTYYDFQVSTSIDAGNWPVQIWTNYPGATEKEVNDMLLFVMACEL